MHKPGSSGKHVIAVASAGVSEALLNEVLEPLGFEPARMVGTLEELTLELRAAPPRLVVVPVPPNGVGASFTAFEAELRRNPATAAIGTAATKDADTVIAALRAGIAEFLVAPVQRTELDAAIQRLRSLMSSSAAAGELVAVYSAKGGTGVSTVATGLAWSLAHRPGRPKVALVDFTTAGAGIRVQLDLDPAYDMSSVAAKSGELDREFLRSCMVAHGDGVSILAATEELDAVDGLDAATASTVLELLCRDFDYVVVDLDHHLSEPTLAALDTATRIVLVSELNVITLRSTQRSLAMFSRLGYELDKISVVMNRCSEQDKVPRSDAERVLSRRIASALPRDTATATDALTFGKFVPQQNAKSPLVAGLAQLAEVVATHGETAGSSGRGPAGTSTLSRLFGRR